MDQLDYFQCLLTYLNRNIQKKKGARVLHGNNLLIDLNGARSYAVLALT